MAVFTRAGAELEGGREAYHSIAKVSGGAVFLRIKRRSFMSGGACLLEDRNRPFDNTVTSTDIDTYILREQAIQGMETHTGCWWVEHVDNWRAFRGTYCTDVRSLIFGVWVCLSVVTLLLG